MYSAIYNNQSPNDIKFSFSWKVVITCYFRYPVYTRHHDYYGQGPAWLPPGSVQMYGHHPHPAHHHYYDPEFRSNSANLPLPPPVEYVWASRPTRRTKSSAHPRQHRHYIHPRHPPSPQFYPPEPPPLVHHSSFARCRDDNWIVRNSMLFMGLNLNKINFFYPFVISN